MIDLHYIRGLVEHLDSAGVLFDQGLTDQEIEAVEATYGFRFPPDLRKLLQYALPIGDRFPNWRKGPPAALRDGLRWPIEGILFEVERGAVWLPAWEAPPDTPAAARERAAAALAAAPPMVPIYGHRYLPAEPHSPGNPVFAIAGSDVIYAGSDLASYFAVEFGAPCPSWAVTTPRQIPFWSSLVA